MVAQSITTIDDGAERANRAIAWLTVERVSYMLLVIAATGVRLWALGRAPLLPDEAIQALPAVVAVRGGIPDLTGVSPLLYSLQRLTFMLFGASEGSARFWPALAGGLSVLLFYFLRHRLTRGGALMAALLWALSPLGVWSSRLGLGDALIPSLALAAGVGLDRFAGRREDVPPSPVLPAIALGLLLIAGANAYTFLLGLVLAGLLVSYDFRPAFAAVNSARRPALVAFAATAVLGATFFLLTPPGLAAAIALAGEWFRGIIPGTGEYSALEMVFRLVMSEFTVLAFGVAGAIWALRRGDRWSTGVAVVAAVAWLIPIAGRGRNPIDLALVSLALAVLSGPVVAQVVRNASQWARERDSWLLVGAGAVLLFAALLALPGAFNPENRADWRGIYLGILIATSAMFVVIWIAYGAWDGWRLVARTLPAVLLVFGLGWQVSQMTALSFDRAAWRQAGVLHYAGATGLQDFRTELRNLSALKGGGPDDARVDVAWPERPGDPVLPVLRWELRDFDNLRVGAAVPADPAPIVITPLEEQTQLSASYGGAAFPILDSWRPVGLGDSFNAYLRWVLFRVADTPPEKTQVLLWFDRPE